MCTPQADVLRAVTGLMGLERGDGELRSDMTVRKGWCCAQVHGSNDPHEIFQLVDFAVSLPCCKRAVGQMVDVVRHAGAVIEECIHMAPRALDCIRISERCM